MTNEYKQIDMIIETYTTRDFKQGFKHAKEKNATEIKFYWGDNMRTPDKAFVQRIKNVWGTMTGMNADEFVFDADSAPHMVIVHRSDNTPIFS